MKITFDTDDWFELKSEDHLRSLYPPPKWGQYRPQPYYEPEKYPCMAHVICTVDNPNGPDEVVLAYIYDYTLEEEE